MPIYRIRWEHRALYNNTNKTTTTTHTHTHARTHARTHAPILARRTGIGAAVKNSLEIVIEQVRL